VICSFNILTVPDAVNGFVFPTGIVVTELFISDVRILLPLKSELTDHDDPSCLYFQPQ
jgi:hypothetical protein